MPENQKEQIKTLALKIIPGIIAFAAASLLIKYYG